MIQTPDDNIAIERIEAVSDIVACVRDVPCRLGSGIVIQIASGRPGRSGSGNLIVWKTPRDHGPRGRGIVDQDRLTGAVSQIREIALRGSPESARSKSTVSLVFCRVCSQVTKKCVLSLWIGPPSAPPNWFRRIGGFDAAKKFRAFNASFCSDSKMLP